MEFQLPQQRGQKPNARNRRGRNNIEAAPLVELKDDDSTQTPRPTRFTEYYHNDEPFEIVFIKDHPRAKKCAGCNNDISRNFLF